MRCSCEPYSLERSNWMYDPDGTGASWCPVPALASSCATWQRTQMIHPTTHHHTSGKLSHRTYIPMGDCAS